MNPIFLAAVSAACREWNVTEAEALGNGRTLDECYPRHAIAWAMRGAGLTFESIGALMRGRCHGSACNSYKQAVALISYDRGFREKALRVRDAVQAALAEERQNDAAAAAVILGEENR